jgi:predicted methyltransferase
MTKTTPRNPWGVLGPAYERSMESCSALLVKAALEQAAPRAGSAVLDVAAGTGASAVAAAERGRSSNTTDGILPLARSPHPRLQLHLHRPWKRGVQDQDQTSQDRVSF